MDEPDTRDNLQNKEQEPLAYLEKISYLLLGLAGIIAFGMIVYIIKVPRDDLQHPIIFLTVAASGLALIAVSFVLRELSSGEKTVKEAIITVTIELAMLGLFILISNLLRK